MSGSARNWEEMRDRIIGLGDSSYRKSYYPELRAKIEELEQAREQIHLSEANLRSVLRSVHDAIVLHDAEGRIFEANEAWFKLYGVPREALSQYTIQDYSGQDTAQMKAICDRVQREGQLVFDWRARRPLDGTVFDVEVAIGPTKWYGQDIFVAAVRDITARKQMEHVLVEAQKMEALGRFAGRVAHDVTNSMTAILHSTDKLLKRVGTDAKSKALVMDIVGAVNRYAGFYGDLLAFVSQRPGIPKKIDLTRTARGMKTFLSRSAHMGVTCSFDLEEGPLPLIGDPVRIEQMLVYMTLHALERMPKGGTYHLKVSGEAVPADSVGGRPGWAVIRIMDTGAPYDPEDIPHLFEPFFVPKGCPNESLGIRLSSVFAIVGDLDGKIEVESRTDGTTVTVRLPLQFAAAQEPVLKQEADTAGGGPSGGGPSERGPRGVALVVDDEPVLRTLLRVQLSKLGLQVVTAGNEAEALRCSDQYPGNMDYLFVDVSLGEVSGAHIADQIRQQRPGIPVIYMSGYPKNDLVGQGILDETVWFLEKPFDQKALEAALQQVNHRSGNAHATGSIRE